MLNAGQAIRWGNLPEFRPCCFRNHVTAVFKPFISGRSTQPATELAGEADNRGTSLQV